MNTENFNFMNTENFNFILTNSNNPEQYNIVDKSFKFKAYLNVRGGRVSVHPYEFDGKTQDYFINYKKTIYTCEFVGMNEFIGCIPEKLKLKIFNEIDDTLISL